MASRPPETAKRGAQHRPRQQPGSKQTTTDRDQRLGAPGCSDRVDPPVEDRPPIAMPALTFSPEWTHRRAVPCVAAFAHKHEPHADLRRDCSAREEAVI